MSKISDFFTDIFSNFEFSEGTKFAAGKLQLIINKKQGNQFSIITWMNRNEKAQRNTFHIMWKKSKGANFKYFH